MGEEKLYPIPLYSNIIFDILISFLQILQLKGDMMKSRKFNMLFGIIIFSMIFVFVLPSIITAQNNNNDNGNENNNQNDQNQDNQNNNNNNDDWFNDEDIFNDIDEDDFVDNYDENGEDNNSDTGEQNETTPAPVYDLLNIGGSLNLELPINVGEVTEDAETIFDNTYMLGTPLSSMIYLSSRLNETIRSYMEFDLSFTPRYYDGLFMDDWVPATFNVELDEMFLDINANYKLFMRFGKQNIKWGAGFRWSPTDFINKERKDPLEPETDRNGITGLKFTLPIETFNLIAFVGLEGLADILDVPITLRAEYAYKFFEISATVYVENGKIPQYGFDYALGKEFWGGTWELNGEFSYSYGSNNLFIGFDPDRPGIDPTDPDFQDLINNPDTTEDELLEYFVNNAKFYTYQITDQHFLKAVAGLTYTTSKAPEWMGELFMLNIEYYYNSEGYDYPDVDDEGNEINLIPYTLFYNQLVETGKHYLGASLVSSNPFTIDDFSLNVNYIINLTDFSQIVFASFSYSGVDRLSISSYFKLNFGEEGTEYYFASPITVASFFRNLMDNFDFVTQEITGYDGVLREYFTFGIRLGVNF